MTIKDIKYILIYFSILIGAFFIGIGMLSLLQFLFTNFPMVVFYTMFVGIALLMAIYIRLSSLEQTPLESFNAKWRIVHEKEND